MHTLWCIATTLALLAILTSCQNLGENNGINVRLSQRGLTYASQKAVNDLYDKYRHEPINDFSNSSEDFSYNITNIKIPSLSRPTFNLQINPNQGISPILHLGLIEVTGTFNISFRVWWFRIQQSGNFTARASQISTNIGLGVGRDGSGRPTTSVISCTSNIGAFQVDITASGLIGWIIDTMEGTISENIKSMLAPMLCEQVEKLVDKNLNPELQDMKVSTTLQDGRLHLNYALLQAPTFTANYFDTTIKGDVTWKGRNTGTPSAVRSWPAVPGSSAKMATIYITDYIMNAMGVLLHNDGSLSYNVTRDEVSSSIRPQLALSCPDSFCAGNLFEQLAEQYPDGWLEAGLRTNAPPRLIIGDNVLTGNFSGLLDVYVKTPNGQRILAASATASIRLPLSLTISDNILKASVRSPSISVTPTHAITDGLQKFLSLLSEGFINTHLNEIGQRGFELPTYKNVTFLNSQIHIGSGVIAVSTDANYNA